MSEEETKAPEAQLPEDMVSDISVLGSLTKHLKHVREALDRIDNNGPLEWHPQYSGYNIAIANRDEEGKILTPSDYGTTITFISHVHQTENTKKAQKDLKSHLLGVLQLSFMSTEDYLERAIEDIMGNMKLDKELEIFKRERQDRAKKKFDALTEKIKKEKDKE